MYISMCSQTKSSFSYIPAIKVKESSLSHLSGLHAGTELLFCPWYMCMAQALSLLHLKLLTSLKIKVESGQCPQTAVNQ